MRVDLRKGVILMDATLTSALSSQGTAIIAGVALFFAAALGITVVRTQSDVALAWVKKVIKRGK